MTWRCFSTRGLGHLVKISEKMNDQIYKNIIEEHLDASASDMDLLGNFIF